MDPRLIETLSPWGIRPVRRRDDLSPAGSPERVRGRAVVEDDRGGLFLLEELDPAALPRKRAIAGTLARLAPALPEVLPYLPVSPGEWIASRAGRHHQVRRYVEGAALERPGFAFEGPRGDAAADFLVRLAAAARSLPGLAASPGPPFSVGGYVRDLMAVVGRREPGLHARLRPEVGRLEGAGLDALDRLPRAFAHGDFHPLNAIWTPAGGIAAVIDWEFSGPRPEGYDAAVFVGCVGMEDPRALRGDLVRAALRGIRRDAGWSAEAWRLFPVLAAALRFAWLSEWLRKDDREMVGLETVYIGRLVEEAEAALEG